jgi:hypothetical protein
MKTRLFALMFVIATGQVQGQQSSAPAVGEQQALDQQRNEVMAKKQAVLQAHAKLQEQCWQRFAVNDCLRDVRRAQRKALAPVEAQLIELNARERQLRLQEREQRLQDKAK